MINLKKIIGIKNFYIFIALIFFIFIASIFEAFSISLIIPLMDVLSSEDFRKYPEYLLKFTKFFKIENYNELVKYIFIITIIVFLFRFFIFLLSDFLKIWFSTKIRELLQISLFSNYIRFNYPQYLKKRVSDLVKNIINETIIYSDKYVFAILNLITDLMTTFLLLTLLFFFNFQITSVVILIILLLGTGYFFFSSKKIKKLSVKRSNDESLLFKIYSESLNNFKDIKVYNIEEYILNKAKPIISSSLENYKKLYQFQVTAKPLFEISLIVFFLIFSLISVIFFNSKSSYIITTFALFSASAFRIIPALSRILNNLQDLKFSKNSKLILEEDIINFNKNFINKKNLFVFNDKKNIFNNIKIQNLNYSYANKKILQNINLNIDKKIVGIMGISGSGKSTLINLILGLIQADTGKIIYNIDDKEFSLPPINLFSYVPQEIFLLNDTILANIIFGKNFDNDNQDIKVIDKIIDQVQLREFVNNLPDGLNSFLGDKAKNISGGQVQRIALARALYRGGEVLVLDEFTNQLDQYTENKILKIIKSLQNFKTVIIVSHKKSSLDICDIIYKIENNLLNIHES